MEKRKITIADVRLSGKAKKYVDDVLDNNRLTYGPYTDRFERGVAEKIKRKYAIFVSSGTAALQVSLHALKEMNRWDDGDEIVLPAVTFVSSLNVILHNRLHPVFVDVERDYYCLDPEKIEKKLTKKTRAIMPVHLFGQSSDMEKITKIAKRHNLKVIEDSCESMFVNYMGRPVGSWGDLSVFSTYVSHLLTTGVGGIVATDNLMLSETIRSLVFHGRDNLYLKIEDDDNLENDLRLISIIERRFQYKYVGYNFRLTEIEAALGLAVLEEIDRHMKARIKIGQMLTKRLNQFDLFFQLPSVRPQSEHAYMLYPMIIKDKIIEKEDLLFFLEKNGIETRNFMQLLTQPVYKKIIGDIEDNYPVAKYLVSQGFIIGCHQYLSNQDVEYVYNVIRRYLKTRKFL